MSTVFEVLSYGFYSAFFEPEPEKRKASLEAWIKESTPVVQSAVENEIRAYLAGILKDTWDEKRWKARVEKFLGTISDFGRKKPDLPFFEAYKLCLDIKLLRHRRMDEDITKGPLDSAARQKLETSIQRVKTALARLEPPPPVPLREIDLHGYRVDEALSTIKTFINVCYRDNVRRVRIIHGKGTGAIKDSVRESLEGNELVMSFDFAEAKYGGEGATDAILAGYSIEIADSLDS